MHAFRLQIMTPRSIVYLYSSSNAILDILFDMLFRSKKKISQQLYLYARLVVCTPYPKERGEGGTYKS